MVDCRPAGAPPHELAHATDALHTQQGAGGDMAPAARASTPAASVPPFAPAYAANGVAGVAGYCAPYCGVKSLVWCGPHPPPPPPPVNPHVYKSVQPSGADLPMNDIATLRFYFNLGVECMWAAYGPPPPAPPPRHYSPRDLAQDMAQVSLQEREGSKHKADKPAPAPPKPPQRPLLGPRFKRGGNNQDGNQNNGHNQNKGHNNNMPNKGPNNRRNSHAEARYAEECVEPPLVSFPYIPYPPPLYPVPYYPVDSDPAMMGMMGGMGYVGYDEGVEYAPVQHFYPPPYPHPHPHPHPHHHPEHK